VTGNRQGRSNGQTKEASGSERVETREGAEDVHRRPAKRPVSKKAKRSPKKVGARLARKARPATAKARPRKRKRVPAPAPQVETEIVDVVEEPLPGVVTVTEIESTRVILPDSGEEKGD
jgi:hypothetical protein